MFKKPPSTLEVLNDLDRHLMNFYLVTKYRPEALAAEIAALQPGRDLFYMLREELDRPMLTDFQKAAVYYYIPAHLATSHGRPGPLPGRGGQAVIPQVADRLQDVMLENIISWGRFIKLYDSPETFFSRPTPYIGHREYRHNFKDDDFKQSNN